MQSFIEISYEEEEEDAIGISSTKRLPPKKRAKWTPSSSPRASPSGEEQFARYEDVTVMPQLMRTINREKRIERLGKKEEENEDVASRQPTNMMTHYRDSRMANNNNSLEAAQALVSLEQQNSQSRNSFSFGDTLALYNQEIRYNNPSHYPPAYSGTNLESLSQNSTSLREAYASLERRVIHEEMRSQLDLERRMREEIALNDMMARMSRERLNRREVMRTQPQPQSWPRMMSGVQQSEPQPRMNRNLGNADHCLHASLPPSWPRMASTTSVQQTTSPQMNRTLDDRGQQWDTSLPASSLGRRDVMHQQQPQSWPRMSSSIQQTTSPQRNRALDTVSKDEYSSLGGLCRFTSDSRPPMPDDFCAPPPQRKGGFNRAA